MLNPSFIVVLSAVGLSVARGDKISTESSATSFIGSATPQRHLLSCSLQRNVDFVGNDLANVRGIATDCCAKCSARTGCNAFTWTNYKGGTCWLKTTKGATVVAKAGAVSAEMPRSTATTTNSSASSTCSPIESGVDYVANDIANVAGVAVATDCCAICSARADCGAFTWTKWKSGTCWLKSGKGATIANPGAYSSSVNRGGDGGGGSSTCSVVETDTDFTGADIANVPGSSAADCCAKCGVQQGCGAFTWTNWNGGTCWLKSGKTTGKFLAGAVSAVVSSPSATPAIPATPATPVTPVTPATTTSPTVVPSPDTTAPPSPPASTSAPTVQGHVQPRLRAGEIPLRAVNLGGWLVAERWMSESSPAWVGVEGYRGEYDAMLQLGAANGTAQFEQHRATWITEADIKEIADAGLNTVRVPVGFWIVNDSPLTWSTAISRTYAHGALKFLDTLINDWAVKYNVAVMLSLHAHQGSQNGYDHSAPQEFGKVSWSDAQVNVDNSLQFVSFLAATYKDSIAFLGMNVMNEPMYPTDLGVLQAYYKEAYRRVRDDGNDCILVVSPLLWNQSPPTMMDFMLPPMYVNVWHEFHVYFRWTLEGNNEPQIMEIAKHYRSMNIDPWTGNPLLLGEWSLAGPDSAPFQDKDQLKQYAAIQLTNYEAARAGWAFWSWRHDEEATKLSGWSLRQLLREGIFTIPRVN